MTSPVGAEILAALAGGPLPPSAVLARTNCASLQLLRHHAKPLFASLQIQAEGATMNRVWMLTGQEAEEPVTGAQEPARPKRKYTTRAKDVRQVPEASPTSTPAATGLDVVEGRDREVLSLIEASGHVGRSLRELHISRSEDSEVALSASLTRLRVKKRVECDDNGKWTAVA